MELLTARGATVSYTDPYVPTLTFGGHRLDHVPFETALTAQCDCAIVATDHAVFDYGRIAGLPLVVDTRNALKAFARPSIYRL
jgi:UDP-N-acetyl-D-mannosaminuronate dehydrogenase